MRKKCPFPNSVDHSRRAKIAAAALCVFSGAPALFAERTQFTPYSSDDGRYGEITTNPWYGDKELSGGMTSAVPARGKTKRRVPAAFGAGTRFFHSHARRGVIE